MLGEQIGEEKGKVTARRVLSIDGGTKVEVSFQSSGKLPGLEHQSTVTYTAAVRPDGSVDGEAQGLVAGKAASGRRSRPKESARSSTAEE